MKLFIHSQTSAVTQLGKFWEWVSNFIPHLFTPSSVVWGLHQAYGYHSWISLVNPQKTDRHLADGTDSVHLSYEDLASVVYSLPVHYSSGAHTSGLHTTYCSSDHSVVHIRSVLSLVCFAWLVADVASDVWPLVWGKFIREVFSRLFHVTKTPMWHQLYGFWFGIKC